MPQKNKSNILDETLENADGLLKEAVNLYSCEDYKKAGDKLSIAHKIFLANKDITKVSICLSLTGLIRYIDKQESYYKSLLLLEDSKFLAESTAQKLALAINKFAFGQVYFLENKYNEALYYLTFASDNIEENSVLKIKAYEILAKIYTHMKNTKMAYECLEKAVHFAINCDNQDYYHRLIENSSKFINLNVEMEKDYKIGIKQNSDSNTTLLLALSNIARTVNADVNLDKLLITIAEQTRLVLNADRCSVFLYDKEKNELWSKVALGMDSEEIRFSADKGFAGYVVKTGETIKIKDAYKDSRFNKEIDKHTGYKTYNMLCMPMRNIKYEITGVFQVLNKKDGDFTDSDEDILLAIGTNAGIAIENNLLFAAQQKMLEEQQKLFAGFIDTLAASIDARDKITLGHSNRVRLYSELISGKLGLNKETAEIISKAAMLHDIGKIGIRDAVLQKKGSLTKEEYEHIKEHVKITYDILCKTNMNSSFSEIAEIAASHHEKYDGTGYFRGLKGEEIPFGGRILAVSDVFDAVTSVRHYRDRMPIDEALSIIINGRNKHFDGKITDAFLSLPCDVIIDVLISEAKTNIKGTDRKLLASVTMQEFATILSKKIHDKKEQNIIDVFNSYYISKND
ncbi:MAG: HD domain-containing protein [Candidatus Gastranaerophilales bacterium]|nr:HD domain-containing protein [Candidatus Gastranaerophilales bacterium]